MESKQLPMSESNASIACTHLLSPQNYPLVRYYYCPLQIQRTQRPGEAKPLAVTTQRQAGLMPEPGGELGTQPRESDNQGSGSLV